MEYLIELVTSHVSNLLLLQAEEAQRLRKRKKAESMRVLDMEKRQKQRLEEMRETQKKVEISIYNFSYPRFTYCLYFFLALYLISYVLIC